MIWNIPTLGKRCRAPGEPCAVFAGSEGLTDRILAVVDAASPRKQLELHLEVAAFFALAVPAAPLPVPHEEPPEPVRNRVVEELRHLEHLARDLGDVLGKRVQLDFLAEPRSREVRHRDDERGHVLQPLVVEEPHVLEPVGLLDVPYRVLDPPAGQAALHHLPQGLASAHRVQRRQQHHGLFAARPLHDDEMQVGVGPVGEPHGHRAVLHADVVNLVVGLEQDAVLVPERALAREIDRKDLRPVRPPAPVEQMTVAHEPNDEVQPVVDVESEPCGDSPRLCPAIYHTLPGNLQHFAGQLQMRGQALR